MKDIDTQSQARAAGAQTKWTGSIWVKVEIVGVVFGVVVTCGIWIWSNDIVFGRFCFCLSSVFPPVHVTFCFSFWRMALNRDVVRLTPPFPPCFGLPAVSVGAKEKKPFVHLHST